MDGTVYIGDKEIAGSFDAIRALKKLGKRICFFTNNSSKAAEDYIEKLHKMGLDITRDEIYTSGEVTCEYVNRVYPGASVFVMGNENSKPNLSATASNFRKTIPICACSASIPNSNIGNFIAFASG